MCCLPLCISMVKPTISGTIVDRLDHVFIDTFFPSSTTLFTLAINFSSTNGPFFDDLAINYLPFPLPKINLLVCVLLLVFLPLVFHPQGDLGDGIPIPVVLYEPACGCLPGSGIAT